jgi:hypothetical protein
MSRATGTKNNRVGDQPNTLPLTLLTAQTRNAVDLAYRSAPRPLLSVTIRTLITRGLLLVILTNATKMAIAPN